MKSMIDWLISQPYLLTFIFGGFVGWAIAKK